MNIIYNEVQETRKDIICVQVGSRYDAWCVNWLESNQEEAASTPATPATPFAAGAGTLLPNPNISPNLGEEDYGFF